MSGRISMVAAALPEVGSAAPTEAPADRAAATDQRLDYVLVVTGEELLRGVYPDAHTCFITRTLLPLGGHCLAALVVDDRRGDILEAVRWATNQARLVLVTGGLGPTANDVTRDALAEATGIELREQPEALAELERRFQTPREQLRPNLRRQTRVPVRGGYFKNPFGTAVGLLFEAGAAVVVALPGPPRELQPMVTNELVPWLRRKFGLRPPGTALTLRFVGLGQSAIDQTLRERVRLPAEVLVTSLFEGSRVDFTFWLPGQGPTNLARLKKIEADIRRVLGDYLYATDGASLEETVAQSLRARGGRLVLVEVGSGGHLAASLHRAPNTRDVLAAAFVAPTEEAMRQVLGIDQAAWAALPAGEPRLKALGEAAGRRTPGAWPLVVGQAGEAGQGGAAQVAVAVALAEARWLVQRLPLQGADQTASANLVTRVWDLLRRQVR